MRIVILFLILIFSNLVYSQNDDVDEFVKKATYYKKFGNDSLTNQLFYYLKAQRKAKKLKKASKHFEIIKEIGNIYEKKGLFDKSLVYYLDFLNIYSTKDGNLDYLEVKIGNCYSELNKPELAYSYYNNILQRVSYPKNIYVLGDIVKAYYKNEKYDKALIYNKKIKKILEKNNNNSLEKAKGDNNLGYNYNISNDFAQSIYYLKKAEARMISKGGKVDLPILINIGITYYNIGEYDKSLEYLFKALKNAKDKSLKSEINQILGTSYHFKRDFSNALSHYDKAESIAKSDNNLILLSDIYLSKAKLYNDLQEYDDALLFYQKYFTLKDSIDKLERIEVGKILYFQDKLVNVNRELDSLETQNKIQQFSIEQLQLKAITQNLELQNLKLDSIQQESRLEQLKQEQLIKDATIKNQKLEFLQQQQQVKIANQNLLTLEKEKEVALLEKNKKEQEQELQQQHNLLEQEHKDKEISRLEFQKQARFRNNLIIILTLVLVLLFGLFRFYRAQKRDHSYLKIAYVKIEESQGELISAEKKIKHLLGQQVSEPVAMALINNQNINEVKELFVAVMFLDIRDFSIYAENRKPEEIIKYQNEVFGFMIEIVEKNHGVVNQLLGDGFMATFGVPSPIGNTCLNAYKSSIEILDSLNKKNKEKDFYATRIGIGLHAGKVVTGNVGTSNRQQFSITGKTVIISARLEQLNKEYGTNFIYSKNLYDELPPENQAKVKFTNVELKGVHKAISITMT